MAWRSILFPHSDLLSEDNAPDPPPFFHDLGLDQIVQTIIAGRESYRLASFFATPLRDADAIRFRQEVFRDLERDEVYECVTVFARAMHAMRESLALAEKLHHRYQRARWFLDAVGIYIDAVNILLRGLAAADLRSRGLMAFRDDLWAYVRSPAFTDLVAEQARVLDLLGQIRYCLHLHNQRIVVRRYAEEIDYADEIAAIFARFSQYATKDYRAAFREAPEMNHVEEGILDRVASLYSDTFATLSVFCERYRDYLDAGIAAFDREIQFYVAYIDCVRRLKITGLPFCYPDISERSREVFACDNFDFALAIKLLYRTTVVRNDFFVRDPERIIVVSGPNQGGKTTFARAFGQMHYLAHLGCPVPGSEVHLPLIDQIFTHFERNEEIINLRGKLEDDLVRLRAILDAATSRSLIILNEPFASTTFRDALFLGKKVLQMVAERDCLCVCVTFLDELSALSEKIVSMVSTVAPHDPAVRTFKIVRRPADGRAYAAALAEKYGLSYERLKERIVQ